MDGQRCSTYSPEILCCIKSLHPILRLELSFRYQRTCILDKLVSEPTREGAPLDLLFVNREGLVGDVMAGGHLGHSDHEMTEFLIL